MPRVSAAFYSVGVLCVIAGMLWGMHMGESQDFVQAPSHAHLNLAGWVTMALYGTFYALTKETYSPRLAWTNFLVAMAGALVMVPSLALFLASGNDPKLIPFMVVGEVLLVLGALIFAVSVFRELFRKRV